MKTFKIIYLHNGRKKVGVFNSVMELPLTASIISIERNRLNEHITTPSGPCLKHPKR